MSKKIVLDEEELKKLSEQYLAGRSLRDLDLLWGISRPTIKILLEDNGLDIRPAHVQRRRHSCEYSFFDKIDTEEKAYWLGFIMADGSVCKTGHNLSLGLGIKDIGHLYKFKEHLKATQPIWENKVACRISISGIEMIRSLEQLGVVPNKTFKAIVPKIDMGLSRHFWRGIVDGDGSLSLSLSSNQWSVSLVGTIDIICGFQQVAHRICETRAQPRQHWKTKGIYNIIIGGNNKAKKLSHWLYNDSTIFLDRKYAKYKEIQAVSTKRRGKPLGGWPSEVRRRQQVNYGKVL